METSTQSAIAWHRRLPIIYGAFWTTILLMRLSLILFLMRNIAPAIIIKGIHFHHFATGFLIVVVTLFLERMDRVPDEIKSILYGVALGLVVDEFIFWTRLDFNYWDFYNFVATMLTGISVLLLYYFVYNKTEPKNLSVRKRINPATPFVSVVIPAHNEEQFISSTLNSLIDQTYQNFEIIVIDNNCTDETADLAANFGARVITETNPGVGHARQAGFMAARGQIIATTDADTLVPKDWLEKIVKQFEKNSDVVAYGGLFRLHSGPISAKLVFPDIASLIWLVDRQVRGGWSLPGSNMAVRKDAFLKVGGFDTSLHVLEDVDLSQRLRKVGQVVFDRNFLVSTSGRRFRKGLIRGAMTYAKAVKPIGKVLKKGKPELTPVREEKTSRWAFLYPLIPVVLLVLMFLFHNTVISEVKERHEEASFSIRYEARRMGTFLKNQGAWIRTKWKKSWTKKSFT